MESHVQNSIEVHSLSPEKIGSEAEVLHISLGASATNPPGEEVNLFPVHTTETPKTTFSTGVVKSSSTTFPKSIIKKRDHPNSNGPPKVVTVTPTSNWDPSPIVPQQSDSKGVIETIGLIVTESDVESDVDLFRQMSRSGSVPLDQELAEGSVLSPDEDDDEEEFKVHFVHHGKKVQDNMNHQPDLMYQINELQEAVVSMKGSLNEAVMKLSSVEGSSSAGAELEDVKRKCEGNSAEILKMVLALKTDFSCLRHEVTAISKRQEALHKTIRLLVEDRRVLANDLSQAGVISQHTRSRLDSSSSIIGIGGGTSTPGSGSHSNDSGVALPLEKSHPVYADESGPLLFSGQRTSDQDSLPDQPSLLVPASVYDYVAGLSHPDAVSSAASPFYCQDSLPRMVRQQQSLSVKDGDQGLCGNDDLVVYDSDSSLTVAANKTISLSACISQEMKVSDGYSSSHHSANHRSNSPRARSKRSGRGDSESADCSNEKNSSQARRRRPLLGVSSTKVCQSNGQPCPSLSEDSYLRYRYVKSDPREVQRYRLAKELVETEKEYCKTLWTIQDVFAEPLKKAAILSNKDIATLFPEEVYQLYDKHCFLQHQLRERLASWKWQPLIGDILSRFTDTTQCQVLRLYTNYVNDFPEVLKTFHKLCHTSQPFTDFIKNCLDQPACNGLDLGSFLLTPVQRVPKYILLLKQLLKYTSSSHPDYNLISTVLERLRDFLSRLNDAMEHSFRLVNSSLSPTLSSSGLVVSSSPSKHRCGRPTRKSGGSSHDSSSYSPSNRRNRHARVYQPPSPSPGNIYRSPKRSCSSAGGASSSPKTPSPRSTAERSASLPRGFTSMSSDSPDSSGDAQESSPERTTRSRSESSSRYRLYDGTRLRPRSKYPSLTPARSVTDVATGNELKALWEDIASSEPSLVGPKPPPAKALLKKVPSLNSSNNHQTLTTVEGAHKVTWTDSVDPTDESRGKKKTSIKSSIKNIFTFKKRTNSNRNSREEPLYWPSSVIFETPAEGSPSHQHVSKITTQTSAPVHVSSSLSVPVGDFVDEEGNQCSNV